MPARIGTIKRIVYVDDVERITWNDKAFGTVDETYKSALLIVLTDVFISRIGYEYIIFACRKRTIIGIIAASLPFTDFLSAQSVIIYSGRKSR